MDEQRFGQTGPRAHAPGFANVAEAVGGLRYITGEPGRPPVRSGVSLGDTISGLHAAFGVLAALWPGAAFGQGSCLRVEAYTRKSSPQSQKAQAFLAGFEARNRGVRVDVYDVETDAQALARLKALAGRFNVSPSVPTFYAGGRLLVGFQDDATTGSQIEGLLTMEVFTRNGCPRCAQALPFHLAIWSIGAPAAWVK